MECGPTGSVPSGNQVDRDATRRPEIPYYVEVGPRGCQHPHILIPPTEIEPTAPVPFGNVGDGADGRPEGSPDIQVAARHRERTDIKCGRTIFLDQPRRQSRPTAPIPFGNPISHDAASRSEER